MQKYLFHGVTLSDFKNQLSIRVKDEEKTGSVTKVGSKRLNDLN